MMNWAIACFSHFFDTILIYNSIQLCSANSSHSYSLVYFSKSYLHSGCYFWSDISFLIFWFCFLSRFFLHISFSRWDPGYLESYIPGDSIVDAIERPRSHSDTIVPILSWAYSTLYLFLLLCFFLSISSLRSSSRSDSSSVGHHRSRHNSRDLYPDWRLSYRSHSDSIRSWEISSIRTISRPSDNRCSDTSAMRGSSWPSSSSDSFSPIFLS